MFVVVGVVGGERRPPASAVRTRERTRRMPRLGILHVDLIGGGTSLRQKTSGELLGRFGSRVQVEAGQEIMKADER